MVNGEWVLILHIHHYQFTIHHSQLDMKRDWTSQTAILLIGVILVVINLIGAT